MLVAAGLPIGHSVVRGRFLSLFLIFARERGAGGGSRSFHSVSFFVPTHRPLLGKLESTGCTAAGGAAGVAIMSKPALSSLF